MSKTSESKTQLEFSRCHFVEQPPDYLQLKCPVCLDSLLPEPYLASCCGNHFCEKCVKLLEKKPCPLCKADHVPGTRIPDKGQQRALNGLAVYCLNKTQSCEWKGELSSLRNHLSESCVHTLITCKFNCGSKVSRKNVKVHESEKCPHRPSTCKHCKTYSSLNALVSKHEEKCPKAKILCPHCSTEYLREDLQNHARHCSHLPVEGLAADVSSPAHGWARNPENDLIREHYILLQQTIQKQEVKISALFEKVEKHDTLIQKLVEQIESIESTQNTTSCPLLMLPAVPEGKKTFKIVIDRFTHKRTHGNLHHSTVFKFSDDSSCSMQLTIYLNGMHEGRGSHVSVYVGFPESLPFCGSMLLIRLCSQHTFYEHHDKVLKFDANISSVMEHVALPSGPGQRIGLVDFIEHRSIAPYLKNDCLVFELPQIIV